MKDTIKKINKARCMPPKFLMECAIKFTKRRIRRYTIKVHPVKLSDRDFLNVTGYKTIDEFLNRHQPLFFFNSDDRDRLVEIIKKDWPKSIEQTISEADEISNHVFNLLGSGKVKLGKEIDWHLDFKSGFRWNQKTYYLWTGKHVTLDAPSDVKVPWELSRCQHFVTLGKAYWYTNDEKYAKEFNSQIESWINQNPIELGVNWACTMDVAIRAVNWIWGYYFFSHSKTLTKEFKVKFLKNLFLHGRHIINNLEFGLIRSNHYLSDIVGLIYLGILFQETKEGKKWLKNGLSALEEEMEFQVLHDGVNFEASLSYHRLVTELFLSSVILCKMNNIDIPDQIMSKLEKMIDFTMYYTKPDGMCPVIGDADNGRLHILSKNNINNHRYLLSIGAVLFARKDFKSAYPVFNEEAFWLLGRSGLDTFNALPNALFELKSNAFRHGGFYIMRNGNLYMIIRCGDVGLAGHGGHGHCDCLSFELFADDRAFIIDPGAYIYTANKRMRNLFRSTKYHNTIVIDEEEMNRFEKEELFAMQFDAVPKVNKWVVTDEYCLFDGEHYGYCRLESPITHRRKIYFNKKGKYWEITDILTGKGEHKFEWYFHFVPMKVKQDEKNPLIVRTKCNGANIELVPREVPEGMECEILEGWVSYSYGRKRRAPIVRYSVNRNANFESKILINLIEGEA